MPLRSDRRLTGLVLCFALAAMLAACGGKKRPPVLATTPGSGPAATEGAEAPPAQRIDEGPDVRAMDSEGALGADIAGRPYDPTSSESSPLDDVRFALDSASLTEEARSTLERHALWLQSHREINVIVEGHCDERGTVEYNLALGEQRARAARDYLASLGVAADRLRTVSYGKERPLDPGSGEEAWARNRRAHFALTR